jgi:hypothetical protein
MTQTSGDARSDRGLDCRLAEQATEVDQRIERARQNVNAAQRSAAASMRKSAESQDRVARMYEERAKHGLYQDDAVDHDDDLDHAARHRQFAEDDRWMAERARQSADEHLARRTWG